MTYRSTAPLGSTVNVGAEVAGVPGTAETSYRAPSLNLPSASSEAQEAGWWTSTAALLFAALLCASLIGWALYVALRPRPVSVTERIETFITAEQPKSAKLTERQMATILNNASRSLARIRGWAGFELDVDVGRIQMPAARIAVLTGISTLLVGWLCFAVIDRVFVGVILLFAIPWAVRKWVAIKADRQRRKFADDLVDNLQVVVSAMRAGHSFIGALAIAVEDASEPAKSELKRIVRDEQLGTPVEEAVYTVARRMKSVELEHVGLVAALQRETGGNTAEVLDRLIDNIRGRTEIRLLIKTLTAQGRLGGAIITALPILVAVLMNAANPGYMDPMLDSPGGTLVLMGAALAVLVGWITIRKIVDIKV